MKEKALFLVGLIILASLAVLLMVPVNKEVETDVITSPIDITNPKDKEISGCKPTGCSGQVCSDEEVITTCEFKEEYVCYKTARCERQVDERCGWTETSELKQCLVDLSLAY